MATVCIEISTNHCTAFEAAMLRWQSVPSDSDVETTEARVRQVARHADAADSAVTEFAATVESTRSRARWAERDKARLELAEEERLYAEDKAEHEARLRSMQNRGARMDALRFELNR